MPGASRSKVLRVGISSVKTWVCMGSSVFEVSVLNQGSDSVGVVVEVAVGITISINLCSFLELASKYAR